MVREAAATSRGQRGVSLIEMAIAMAIFALLYALAAPSFTSWIANVQIRTATESMQNGLQLARAEAIRRNTSVIFWLSSQTNPAAADWLVGCANPQKPAALPEAPGDCPGVVPPGPMPVGGVNGVDWIQQQNAADQQTAYPIVTPTPAAATYVTFNSVGMILSSNLDGSAPLTQIDVTQANGTVRPLRITLNGGQIRMCDPALSLSIDPRGC